MVNYKISLLLSWNYFKNMQLSKIDRFLNTSISTPPLVCIRITEKCNGHCRQCDLWKRTTSVNELDTNQWKEVILKLRKWIGPFYLNILGGEPFLRKDLFEIIDFAYGKDVFTDVITNGLLLSNRLKELNNSKLSKLTISLDGVTARTHDFLRGRGSFNRVIPAINALCKNRGGLVITINTIMVRQNLQELPALIRFVKANDLNGIFLRVLCWEGFNKTCPENWFSKNPLWPGNYKPKVGEIIEELIQLKKEGYPIINSVKYLQIAKEYFENPDTLKSKNLTCLSPHQCLIISTTGEAKLCSYHPLGNILEEDISKTWKSEKVRRLRCNLLNCKKSCMLRDWQFEDTTASKISRARKALFGK